MKKIVIIIFLLMSAISIYSDAAAAELGNLRINGFFDLEYEKAYSSGNSAGDTKGSFDQQHFNILLEFPVSNAASVKGHIEYEHGPQLSGDSAGTGDINIEWSYLEYLVNNNLKLRGGIILTPFGLYNEIHDATPTYVFIRIPWSIYNADLTGGFAMFPKVSTGINILGNYFSDSIFNISYTLYIANGENRVNNGAEKDDNSNKAIGGRLMVAPVDGLNIGGSFFTDKIGKSGDNHFSWLASFDYIIHPLQLRAEYASSEITGMTGITETSWYGEASYMIRKFSPYVRYNKFDPDISKSDDEWTCLIYGLAYKIQPNLILKVENRQIYGSAGNSDVQSDYNEAGVAITAAF